jgi:hypothetical protein
MYGYANESPRKSLARLQLTSDLSCARTCASVRLVFRGTRTAAVAVAVATWWPMSNPSMPCMCRAWSAE